MAEPHPAPPRRWLPWQPQQQPGTPSAPRAEQLLSWIDSSPVGWVLLDAGDQVGHLNPQAGRILGVKAGRHLDGRHLADICPDPILLSSVAMARRQDRPQRLEWHFHRQEFDVMVVPAAAGWIGVQLQNRRSLEAQLEQQERWVSDVAHELKTPLTALLLVGDSLAAQVTDQNARLVERLQRELLRLQELVNDLLELSRLENTVPGRGLRLAPVEISPLVHQVWAGLRPLAEPRGVTLSLKQSTQITLQGDASRLHRALLNLFDNALRYSPDGGAVEVTIASLGGWCQLSVRDHGPGLSRDDLQHMFERFYRGDPARARSQRAGSGLGLSIVQQIAVTHGGRIQASNHPEGGALLDLVLPTAVRGAS